jgi:hypothetical protein
LIVPLILSMVALTDFRKGFPRMMEVSDEDPYP